MTDTSSLLGGGTNVKVAFAKDMKKATDDFEKAQKKLVKTIAKKDRESSSAELEKLASALSMYREAGRLTGPGMFCIIYVSVVVRIVLSVVSLLIMIRCLFHILQTAAETFLRWMRFDEVPVVSKDEPLNKR